MSNIRIIEAQAHSDGSGLLKDNRYIVDGRLPDKVFQISSTLPSQIIVGMRVQVDSSIPNHCPQWVQLNDGRVLVRGVFRSFSFALMRAEVQESASIRLQFDGNQGIDLNCDGLDLFVTDRSEFPAGFFRSLQPRNDWFSVVRRSRTSTTFSPRRSRIRFAIFKTFARG
jgi:hypothetical protein